MTVYDSAINFENYQARFSNFESGIRDKTLKIDFSANEVIG